MKGSEAAVTGLALQEISRHRENAFGQIGGGRGRDELIGDHRDFVLSGRAQKDGFGKIPLEGAVGQGGAQDDMRRLSGRDRAFTLLLGTTVSTQGIDCIRLPIGGCAGFVENIGRGEMDERNSKLAGADGDRFGTLYIDGFRVGRIELRPFNIGVGGRADDNLRARGGNCRLDRARVRELKRRPPDRQHLKSLSLPNLQKTSRNLSPRARNRHSDWRHH
jgi:hypothetical protein